MFEKVSLMIRKILGNIIMKVLFMPGVREWFDRVVQLYEKTQIDDECDVLEGRGGDARLNFSHYLPHTEERIERLRRLINKRPVVIILHGPSVKELESRINELKDCDICYFGLNYFRGPEEHVLQKINRTYSVVMVSAILAGPHGVTNEVNYFVEFLERPEANMVISDGNSFRALEAKGFDLGEFVKKYDNKILFFTGNPVSSITISSSGDHWSNGGLFLQVPSIEYPLHFPALTSFSVLLSLALIGQAPMVVVFGGDGGRTGQQELYYRETSGGIPDSPVAEQSITVYTKSFNITMPLILEKIYKMYNLKPVDIINCSLQSNYTPMRKLSYDDTFALLKSFKLETTSHEVKAVKGENAK